MDSNRLALVKNQTHAKRKRFNKINNSIFKCTTIKEMLSTVLKGSTTLDRKRIYANHSSYPKPKAQLCFRTDEMTSFFDQM